MTENIEKQHLMSQKTPDYYQTMTLQPDSDIMNRTTTPSSNEKNDIGKARCQVYDKISHNTI